MGGAAGGYRCEQGGAVAGECDDQSGGFVLGGACRLGQGRPGGGKVGSGDRRCSHRRRDGAGGWWERPGPAQLGAQCCGMRRPVLSERPRRCGQRRVGLSLRLDHRLRQRRVSLGAPGW